MSDEPGIRLDMIRLLDRADGEPELFEPTNPWSPAGHHALSISDTLFEALGRPEHLTITLEAQD